MIEGDKEYLEQYIAGKTFVPNILKNGNIDTLAGSYIGEYA